jgi:phosphoribosylformylglycinamidine synthase
MPVAHGDGRFTADQNTLDHLEGEGHVVFRYVDATGEATPQSNPNGSERNIAGIVNDGGNVIGLMPHPERAMDSGLGSRDGVAFFESLLGSVPA